MAQTWLNSDGLYIKFGQTEATRTNGGSYEDRHYGSVQIFEIEFDLTGITATAGATILADNVVIPKNAQIEFAELLMEVAATSGGSAALNVGLCRLDRSTEIDFDGIIAAGALATHNAIGSKVVYTKGSTAAGALIGQSVGSNPGLVVADYDTAAYTAGRGVLRIAVRPNFTATN